MEQKDHFVGIEMVSLFTRCFGSHATRPSTAMLQFTSVVRTVSPQNVYIMIQTDPYAHICRHVK